MVPDVFLIHISGWPALPSVCLCSTHSFNQSGPFLGRDVVRDDPGVDDRLKLEAVDFAQGRRNPSIDALCCRSNEAFLAAA
jgi:hypothetical protein